MTSIVQKSAVGMLAAMTGLAVALSLAAGCKPAPQPAAEPQDVDLTRTAGVFSEPANPSSIVVVVDGKNITRGEVDAEVAKMTGRMGNRVPPERLAQLREQISQQATENLVIRTLLLDAVTKENISVSDQEIDTALAELTNSLPAGMTLQTIMEQTGLSTEEFRKNLSLDLSVNKLITNHTGEVTEPTAEEVSAFYEENKARFDMPESVSARHILVEVKADDTEADKAAKKAKAEEIRKELVGGADFAALAAEKSDCPSKAQGGNLGTFARGQMVPAFEEAAFSLQTNEISQVVETQFGYHIIEVLKHDQPKTMGLDDVKERIGRILKSQKRQQAVQNFIETLKAKASITYPES